MTPEDSQELSGFILFLFYSLGIPLILRFIVIPFEGSRAIKNVLCSFIGWIPGNILASYYLVKTATDGVFLDFCVMLVSMEVWQLVFLFFAYDFFDWLRRACGGD